MPRPRKLPKDQLIRDVPVLFPTAKLELSADNERFYRQIHQEHERYYFGIDRQSDKKELSRRDATGQQRRIEAILTFSHIANAWAPMPEYLGEERPEGTPPYCFDRHFWFIDGERKNASGLVANPLIRPEFWRAYDLAVALGAKGIGPAAFIIGEGTRFFRDPEWLGTFCGSLWDVGVEIYIANFGKVDRRTLPGLQSMITALSEWLPIALKGARDARKRDHRIFHGRPPFGIYFSLDKRTVYAHPEQWPVLYDTVEHLADGRIRSLEAAIAWLYEHHKVKRTQAWLGQVLRSRILEGVYEAYRTEGQVRKIRQGPFRDLDVTANGNRRYRKTPVTPTLFPIQVEYSLPGQEIRLRSIPPLLLAQARSRIAIHGGRPMNFAFRNPRFFLGQARIRCAVCGKGIKEAMRRGNEPYLLCCCVESYRMRDASSRAAARELPEAQHVRFRLLTDGRTLSERVWEMLTTEIEAYPPLPGESPLDETTERECLRQEIARLNEQLNNLVESLTLLRLTEDTKKRVETKQLTLSREIEQREREMDTMMTRMIERRRQNQTLHEVQAILREFHRDGVSDELRREMVETVVERVTVHLEQGWFEVQGAASLPALAELRGKLPAEPGLESKSSSEWIFGFQFVLQGRLAA